jgi:hypothetical protein
MKAFAFQVRVNGVQEKSSAIWGVPNQEHAQF